jgi:hypothetical protein
MKTVGATVVAIAAALAVITLVAAQALGGRATSAGQGTQRAAPTGQGPVAATPTERHDACAGPHTTARPGCIARAAETIRSGLLGTTAPVPGSSPSPTTAAPAPGIAPTPIAAPTRVHGVRSHGRSAGARRSHNGEGTEPGDESEPAESGRPETHGAYVSRVARSGCTAVNPHNPAVRNHGMCVRAAAHSSR